MATTPNNPGGSAGLTSVLTKLADANGYISLAVTIAGQVIPLGKWLVSEFKSIAASKDTETYQMVLQTDIAELETIRLLAASDIDAVNAELERLGKPPLDTPPTPTEG